MYKTGRDLAYYVGQQRYLGEDDFQTITRYLVENDLEQEAIDLISKLAKSKAEKLASQLAVVKTWIPILPDFCASLCDAEDEKYIVAHSLNQLQQCCVLDLDLSSLPILFQWAKDNIPKMKVPKFFYVPTITYLAKYEIKFKEWKY